MPYVAPGGLMTSPCGQEVAPANLSARQAKEKGLLMSGKGKMKCIRGAKEWRERAKAVIATQLAAESTTSKGPSWSWSK